MTVVCIPGWKYMANARSLGRTIPAQMNIARNLKDRAKLTIYLLRRQISQIGLTVELIYQFQKKVDEAKGLIVDVSTTIFPN